MCISNEEHFPRVNDESHNAHIIEIDSYTITITIIIIIIIINVIS